MTDPPKQKTLTIDAGTLMLVVSALLLVPLLLAGFWFH